MNASLTRITKEKTPVAGEQGGVFGCNQRNADDTALYVESKSISTWQARFAMLGHTLYPVQAANGATAFLVTRWGMTRELSNLDEVAKFFALIGGKL